MYSFDFKSRLTRLNSNLFVEERGAAVIDGEHKASGIYNRRPQTRQDIKLNYNYLSGAAAKHLEAAESGQLYDFVCGVPVGWIPEHDQFDPMTGRQIARGWRNTLLFLVKKRLCTIERVRKVFSCPSLGLDDYDNWTFAEKQQAALSDDVKRENEKLARIKKLGVF